MPEDGSINCMQGLVPLATNGTASAQGNGVVAPLSFAEMTGSGRDGLRPKGTGRVIVISEKDPTGSRVGIRKSRMLAFAAKLSGIVASRFRDI